MGVSASGREEVEGALDLPGIDTKTLAFRVADHEAKMLVITIRLILE